MTLDEFRQSLTATDPPAELSHALAGLWLPRRAIGREHTRPPSRMRVSRDRGFTPTLHRKEGDQGNAGYWYRRAGKPVCREPLDAEWLSILKALLE
jgi:hypothetical protein